MSTSEGISLQALDSKEAEDGIPTTHTLEPDDTSQLRRSKTMKTFTTVTTLIASAFLFGGISMIGPFYPIVVSFV